MRINLNFFLSPRVNILCLQTLVQKWMHFSLFLNIGCFAKKMQKIIHIVSIQGGSHIAGYF